MPKLRARPRAGRYRAWLAALAGAARSVLPPGGVRGMAVAAPAFCPPAARLAKAPDAPSRISEWRTTDSGHAVALARGRRRVARDACKSFDGHDPDGTGEVTTDQRGLAGLACESSRAGIIKAQLQARVWCWADRLMATKR